MSLPPQLIADETEIGMIIDGILEEIEPIKNNRGKIMKIISANYKGKIDMSVVNKMLGEILA